MERSKHIGLPFEKREQEIPSVLASKRGQHLLLSVAAKAQRESAKAGRALGTQ